MEVINIGDINNKKRKQNLLDIVEKFKEMIEKDQIDEFVIASLDSDGEVSIHANIKDVVGGIGLFEIGKNILIQQQTLADYE